MRYLSFLDSTFKICKFSPEHAIYNAILSGKDSNKTLQGLGLVQATATEVWPKKVEKRWPFFFTCPFSLGQNRIAYQKSASWHPPVFCANTFCVFMNSEHLLNIYFHPLATSQYNTILLLHCYIEYLKCKFTFSCSLKHNSNFSKKNKTICSVHLQSNWPNAVLA